MCGKIKSRLRVLCVTLCLVAMTGLAQASDSSTPSDPRLQIGITLENPKDFHTQKENNPSSSALLKAAPSQSGTVTSKWRHWVGDHGKGLGLGLLVGAGMAIGIVLIGSLFTLSAPVLAVAALGTTVGGALYGLFTGAERFNPVDCAVQALIGGVSAGVGYGLGAAGILVGRALVATKVAIDVIAGGLASTASYLIQTPQPTLGGAVASFGLGAGTAGLFLALGYGMAKLKLAWPARAAGQAGDVADDAARIAGTKASRVGSVAELIDGLAGAPRSVENVFAEVIETGTAADQQRLIKAYATGVGDWIRRNPIQADEMARSGRGLDGIVEAATQSPIADSVVLARNMKQASGEKRPWWWAAHHIVAGDAPEAEQSRILLRNLGIDINDAANGVYLPQKPGLGTFEMYHPSLHTDIYHKEVRLRLSFATNADEARLMLQQIAQQLTSGTFLK